MLRVSFEGSKLSPELIVKTSTGVFIYIDPKIRRTLMILSSKPWGGQRFGALLYVRASGEVGASIVSYFGFGNASTM